MFFSYNVKGKKCQGKKKTPSEIACHSFTLTSKQVTKKARYETGPFMKRFSMVYLSSVIFTVLDNPPDFTVEKYTPAENFDAFQVTECAPAFMYPFAIVSTF